MALRLATPENDRGTLVDLLVRNATQIPASPAITDGPTTWRWSDFAEIVDSAALALDEIGIDVDQTVGIHMANRAEHFASDLGILSVGATPVTVYTSSSPEQLEYLAGDARFIAAIVEAPYLDTWRAVREKVNGLRYLIVLEGPSEPAEDIFGWDELIARGRAIRGAGGPRLVELRRRLGADSPATIIYTSGTTGPPKGVILTNAAIRFVSSCMVERFASEIDAARAAQPALRDRDDPVAAGARQLSYLPLAHGAERLGTYAYGLNIGAHFTMVRQIDQLAEFLPRVHPTFFVAVPRIWEKLFTGMDLRLAEDRGPRGKLGRKAMAVAGAWGRHLADGSRPSPKLKLSHRLFEKLIYPKLRAAIGMDRMALAMTGGAPVTDEILYRFAGLGIPIIEGYGLTECTAMAAATSVGQPRPRSVGWSFTPKVQLRIAEDGEVLIKGPCNTPGYLRRPEATAELIDADGWLHTGDLGRMDSDGALSIVGRKKELIINAAGKNMSPSQIELAVKCQSALLAQVVPFGDRQKYLVALVVLDPDGLTEWARRNGVTVTDIHQQVRELSENPDLRAEVEAAITAGNQQLSRVEHIKKFTILDHFWLPPDSPEVTPTMKAKRLVIADRHGAAIRMLYGDDWA